MTMLVAFCCDLCNPSLQRRSPGDEVSSGYVEVKDPPAGYVPPGWTDFGKTTEGVTALACQVCGPLSSLHKANGRDVNGEGVERAASREAAGLGAGSDVPDGSGRAPKGPRWPSVASPFGDPEGPPRGR